jgi:hypothetical protein
MGTYEGRVCGVSALIHRKTVTIAASAGGQGHRVKRGGRLGMGRIGAAGLAVVRPCQQLHPLPASPALRERGLTAVVESGRRGWLCASPVREAHVNLRWSGWTGGQWRGGVGEWIDRWFAYEEAEDLADLVSFQMQPVQGAAKLAVLLKNERLFAVGLLSHHGDDDAVTAEVVHELEQPVPEGGGAEAWDDGEIAADFADGAADCSTAHLKVEILL